MFSYIPNRPITKKATIRRIYNQTVWYLHDYLIKSGERTVIWTQNYSKAYQFTDSEDASSFLSRELIHCRQDCDIFVEG